MTRPLLAAVDGSPESAVAARWAADEARRRRLPLRLVHVRTWLDGLPGSPDVRALTDRMMELTERQINDTHPGLKIETSVVEADEPVEPLLRQAEAAELLVLGSRGLGGFTGLLLGSVGLATAARCEIPTVLVPAGSAERPGLPDQPEVVVGVDTSAPDPTVLEFAFREAALRGATLRAVHAWAVPPVWGYARGVAPENGLEQFRALERELLTDALTGWREKYSQVELVEDSRVGPAPAVLRDLSVGAALLVVGRRRRSHRAGMHLGPVAHAVLHHTPIPVAVVPHD
ncbi:universal stress protein [Kitasatospora sp. NPDC002227]|uniref:universal stress protein n=1 Tax=Kitasatospora sp. NPDC002227 TaxID=3154773 RepID=UPI00331EDE24